MCSSKWTTKCSSKTLTSLPEDPGLFKICTSSIYKIHWSMRPNFILCGGMEASFSYTMHQKYSKTQIQNTRLVGIYSKETKQKKSLHWMTMGTEFRMHIYVDTPISHFSVRKLIFDGLFFSVCNIFLQVIHCWSNN